MILQHDRNASRQCVAECGCHAGKHQAVDVDDIGLRLFDGPHHSIEACPRTGCSARPLVHELVGNTVSFQSSVSEVALDYVDAAACTRDGATPARQRAVGVEQRIRRVERLVVGQIELDDSEIGHGR